MQPYTFFIEIDFSGPWHCGKFTGIFGSGYFRRRWLGPFAIAYVRMDLKDYGDRLRSGLTEWRSK